MTSPTIIDELREWLNTLPPDFAFLLALPFVIAITAFIQDAIGRQTQRTGSASRESYRRFVLGVRVTTRQWLSRTLVSARHAASSVRRWRWILSNWRTERCPIASNRRGTRRL